MRVILALAIALSVGRVAAQSADMIGQPLPSEDLPIGTIVVRVIDGSVAIPHPNMEVWISIDGNVRTAKTDDTGRATFSGLKVGAPVKVAIKAGVESQMFPVPAKGGVRVMLTTAPMNAPPLREYSGVPHGDEHAPPGTISVHLVYDALVDVAPKQPVYLASYAADGKVALRTATTDAKGIARFTGLDRSGATAYYAMAALPRGKRVDRLAAQPIVPTFGAEVMLSAEKRSATSPPIDDASPAPVEQGKLHIAIQGVTQPDSQVSVVDAATGKPLAIAKTEREVTIAQPTASVIYVDALVKGEHYRSRPFQPVADRGAEATVYMFPRQLITFQVEAEPIDAGLAILGRFRVQNSSWSPLVADGIALPAGATHAEVMEDVSTVGTHGIAFKRALAPGETIVNVRFELPGKDGKVRWDLELPHGTYQSAFRIAKDPGVAITGAPLAATTSNVGGAEYLVLSPITIAPKQRMVMTIDLPALPAGDAAIASACRPMDPDRKTPLRNKPAPDFTATGLDGKPFVLSSLRGKVTLVNFTASWTMPSNEELPTMAPIAKQVEIVLVSSDREAKDVRRKPYRTVLDPPKSGNIGPITLSWGTVLLPESYVIDKRGIVRLYFSNARDWSTPAARACLEAVAK